MYFLFKNLQSAATVAGASELAKRSPVMGGLLSSLPLTSYLVLIWIHYERGGNGRIAALSQSIIWLVLASLALSIALTWSLHQGLGFVPALIIGTVSMFLAYGAMILVLRYFGISL